jgi:hypothetical protein
MAIDQVGPIAHAGAGFQGKITGSGGGFTGVKALTELGVFNTC